MADLPSGDRPASSTRGASEPTAELPQIAGFEVAVHYEPIAPEEFGGDFYDLFALGEDRAGFFLGDVCAKGAQAAAITALARDTMRAAAMLDEHPEAVLRNVNAALLMQSTGEPRTCTAVYGELDASAGAAAVTLAVAGHPAPLIVGADGAVETTPGRSSLLGASDDPVLHLSELRLDPGDALVICSDGMLDALLDGRRIDEDRIASLLAGGPPASAQELVERLVLALDERDRPLRDDVAIMALRRAPAQ